MSIGFRGFVEFLIRKLEEEGIATCGYSDEEVEAQVKRIIWDAYEEWNK